MAGQSQLQRAYQLFFRQKLVKYHVDSPAKIKDVEKKKQFFNEVKVDWQKRRRRVQDREKLKSTYTNQYLRLIKQRFNIPKTKIESGMLLEIRYFTINKTTKKPNPIKKYLILVLHPNWHKYIHCLRFDNIKPMFMKKLIEKVGLTQCTYNNRCMKLNVQQLLLEQKDSRRFYLKELKPKMETRYNKSYRTLKLNRTRVTSLYFMNFNELMDKKVI